MVFGADHVYRMDPRQMIERTWLQRGGHGGGLPVPRRRQPVSASRRPRRTVTASRGSWKSRPTAGRPGQPDKAFASMGNYVFDRDVLVEALRKDAADDGSGHSMGGDIIPMLVRERAAHVYDFLQNKVPGAEARDLGYWRDVGTIDSYFDAHMDLCAAYPAFNLYNDRWPILTHVPRRCRPSSCTTTATGRDGR